MKWVIYLVLALAIGAGWLWYAKPSERVVLLESKIAQAHATNENLEEVPGWKAEMESEGNEKSFTGILLTFLSAGLIGIVLVIEVLPAIAHRFTHAVYDSGEVSEGDFMHDARSKVAQGDYEGAIEAFKEAAAADPLNRLPWVEIAKIQRENLKTPQAAIETLRAAVESQEWEINDASYLLFRLAELYDEDAGNRTMAASILNQIMEQFPNTRHSANARHRLHEWGLI